MSFKCTMILGDCLDAMAALPKKHKMIFFDLPYGHGRNFWDHQLCLADFWERIKITREDCFVCAATGTQPFASELILSNKKEFRYDLVWKKSLPTGFLNANKSPLREHEVILIFSSRGSIYNPIMKENSRTRTYRRASVGTNYGRLKVFKRGNKFGFPRSILPISCDPSRHTGQTRSRHPTQKPIALLDWLIRTYSNPGDSVLDPVSGSGTTAVAALKCGRNVTCIEKDLAYFEASVERIRKHVRDGQIDAVVEVRT